MKWVQFLAIAVVVMALCLGGIGGWLLPQLGFEGAVAQAVSAALGGALLAVLYFRMFRQSA